MSGRSILATRSHKFWSVVGAFAAVSVVAPQTARAQWWADGRYDPFNRNNGLGGSIQTPISPPKVWVPGTHPPTPARPAVQTNWLDGDGVFWEQSPYGSPVSLGRRGHLQRGAGGRCGCTAPIPL
jgi:hypothetical protein